MTSVLLAFWDKGASLRWNTNWSVTLCNTPGSVTETYNKTCKRSTDTVIDRFCGSDFSAWGIREAALFRCTLIAMNPPPLPSPFAIALSIHGAYKLCPYSRCKYLAVSLIYERVKWLKQQELRDASRSSPAPITRSILMQDASSSLANWWTALFGSS